MVEARELFPSELRLGTVASHSVRTESDSTPWIDASPRPAAPVIQTL